MRFSIAFIASVAALSATTLAAPTNWPSSSTTTTSTSLDNSGNVGVITTGSNSQENSVSHSQGGDGGIGVYGGNQNSGKNHLNQHTNVHIKETKEKGGRPKRSETTVDTTTTSLDNSGNAGVISTGSNTQSNSVSGSYGGDGGIWVVGGNQNSGKNTLNQSAKQSAADKKKASDKSSSSGSSRGGSTTTTSTSLSNSGNAGAIVTGDNSQTNSVEHSNGGWGGIEVDGGKQNSGGNTVNQKVKASSHRS